MYPDMKTIVPSVLFKNNGTGLFKEKLTTYCIVHGSEAGPIDYDRTIGYRYSSVLNSFIVIAFPLNKTLLLSTSSHSIMPVLFVCFVSALKLMLSEQNIYRN